MLKNLGVRAQAVNFQTLFRGLVRKRRCPAIFKKEGLTKLRKCDLTVCMTLRCQPQAESKVRSPEPRVTPRPGPLPPRTEGKTRHATRHRLPPGSSSLFQPIPTYFGSFWPKRPAYSRVFQRIPTYSSLIEEKNFHETRISRMNTNYHTAPFPHWNNVVRQAQFERNCPFWLPEPATRWMHQNQHPLRGPWCSFYHPPLHLRKSVCCKTNPNACCESASYAKSTGKNEAKSRPEVFSLCHLAS